MINIKTTRRPLKEDEINLLMKDIKLYPDLVYVKESRFRKYNDAYIAEQDKEFVGLCGIYEMKDWIKLGHYFMGKRYKLELKYKNEIPTVFISGKSKIVLQVRPKSTLVKRNEVMMDWYRKQLKTTLFELISKWEETTGVQIKLWEVKQMKTRWGTCNEKKSKIILNLELAKKPIRCIEYIVVHELLHLLEKKHNLKFIELMNKYIPKWKSIKEELNQFILSHEEWKY